MNDIISKIERERLPEHIAIIMDGNGRWAKKKGNKRIFGHKNGVNAVKETVEAAAELGVKYLTLYAFSTENWNRPKAEVNALMTLLIETINRETDTLMKNNIKLSAIGDVESLPKNVINNLNEAIITTENNDRLNLVLALSYSSHWEIIRAVKQIASDIENNKLSVENLNAENFKEYLVTKNIPDPSLLIRTSGEYRISNFLLWQIAYAELYFTDVLWPDFNKEEFYKAIINYQSRERRFGLISEQLNE